jgi:hypothetical protein
MGFSALQCPPARRLLRRIVALNSYFAERFFNSCRARDAGTEDISKPMSEYWQNVKAEWTSQARAGHKACLAVRQDGRG